MTPLNILLIYPRPDVIKNWRFGYSLSLLRIAAILRKEGHFIKYIDFSEREIKDVVLLRQVEISDAIIIELDAFPLKRSSNIQHGHAIAALIKKHFPEKIIITFGYDCILDPGQRPYSDYTFNTEPEWQISKVINALVNKKAVPTIESTLNENLDILPFPDRSIVSSFASHGGSIINHPNLAKSTLIQTSRGCLNTCTFCQRKGWFSKYREHSVEYVLSEFASLRKEGFKNVWVTDDNFTFRIERAKTILEKLKQQNQSQDMKISLSSWVHIDESFLDIAAEAGVSIISFGIETTNPTIMKYYKKNINLAHIKKIIMHADSIGIYTVGNFIIGAPMETENSIRDTLQFAIDVPFDEVNVKILDYMLGSDLYDSLPESLRRGKKHVFACKENGLNNFYLPYLRNIITVFNEKFRQNRVHKIRKKIEKYGPPYHMLINENEGGKSQNAKH